MKKLINLEPNFSLKIKKILQKNSPIMKLINLEQK